MKINFNQLILDEQDRPIKVADKPDLTLKDICVNSLLSVQQDDKEKEKFERFEIFQKIKNPSEEGFVELSTNEIVVIKKVIGIFQPPLLLGQAFNMLENK